MPLFRRSSISREQQIAVDRLLAVDPSFAYIRREDLERYAGGNVEGSFQRYHADRVKALAEYLGQRLAVDRPMTVTASGNDGVDIWYSTNVSAELLDALDAAGREGREVSWIEVSQHRPKALKQMFRTSDLDRVLERVARDRADLSRERQEIAATKLTLPAGVELSDIDAPARLAPADRPKLEVVEHDRGVGI